ncbi:MAG TPA: helical backbone metal receptor [Longimicrobiales bacterium]|nr:helical backbone metal receptor [Longimicrobiales bacterium]
MRYAALMPLLALACPPSVLLGQITDGGDASGASRRADPALRVVSLHPAATEILLALGASDLLVARMEGDIPTPPEGSALAALPSVGEMLTPNLEVLASVEPDLVIAWTGSNLSALSRVVERRGGRVEALTVERLGDVRPAIERIGAWVGREEIAERLADSLEAKLATAQREAPVGAARPRVLWIVWSEPIMVAGPATFIHDVIEAAGGRNAAETVAAPWPRLGMESIVALDPDVLVWPEGPGLFPAAELPRRAGWRTLAAVEEGRVVVVDAERFHDAGPEIADAALDLARSLRRLGPP